MNLTRIFVLGLAVGALSIPSAGFAEEKTATLRERLRTEVVSNSALLDHSHRPTPLDVAEANMQSKFSSALSVRSRLMVTFSDAAGKHIASGTVMTEDGWIAGKASLFPQDAKSYRGIVGGEAIRCHVVQRHDAHDLIFLKADVQLSQLASDISGEPGKFVTCANEIGVISVGERTIASGEREEMASRIRKFHDRMKLRLSERRSGFPKVLEMDLPITPEDCGAPVIDVTGRLVGIAIARAGLHASYILPMDEVRRLRQ